MNRYVVTIEFYTWAETDKEAIKEMTKKCERQARNKANSCELVEIVEQKFGSIVNREIYKKY